MRHIRDFNEVIFLILRTFKPEPYPANMTDFGTGD